METEHYVLTAHSLQSARNVLFPSLFPSWLGRKSWKSALTDSDSGLESESMKIYRLRLRPKLLTPTPQPCLYIWFSCWQMFGPSASRMFNIPWIHGNAHHAYLAMKYHAGADPEKLQGEGLESQWCPSGSEKWSIPPFFKTLNFCSVNCFTVKNEKF